MEILLININFIIIFFYFLMKWFCLKFMIFIICVYWILSKYYNDVFFKCYGKIYSYSFRDGI